MGRTKLLGAASAIVLAVLPLSAWAMDNFDATFSAGYDNAKFNGASIDRWGLNGSGKVDLGTYNLNLQGDVGYGHYSGSGLKSDNWNIDGALFWLGQNGRVGATVGYMSADPNFGSSFHSTNYGAFGEYFLDCVTLGVKGGGFSGNFGINGDYFGGEVVWYVMPNLNLNTTIDSTHFDHSIGTETDWGIHAEYLISQTTPISIYGGYTNAHLPSGIGNADVWSVGLKLYTNGTAAGGSLDQRQRQGVVDWGVHSTAILGQVF